MPIIFNKRQRPPPIPSSASLQQQHQPHPDRPGFRHAPSGTSYASSHRSATQQQQQPHRNFLTVSGGRVPLVIRRLSAAHNGLRRRASQRARRSITRLRNKGASLRKYIQNPKLIGKVAKNVYQKWHLKHLIPLLFVLLYMVIGAILFFWLEAAAEKKRIAERNAEYERGRLLFIRRMEEILVDTGARASLQKRRAYVEEAVDFLRQTLGEDPLPQPPEWSFSTAMYFSGTIFTTIGYGDIACATFMGRLATVIYAIFGIPLMLITLNELGKFLYKSINEFMAALDRFCGCLCHCCHCLTSDASRKGNKQGDDDVNALENGRLSGKGKENKMLLANNKSGGEENDGDPLKAVCFNLDEAAAEELSLKMEAVDDLLLKDNAMAQEQQNAVELADGFYDESKQLQPNSDSEEGNGEDHYEDTEQLIPTDAPRMHVMVAITCTFAWIFLCAWLFRFWEEWTYWDSLYFMFISLLTVGLGDVNVKRRDLMVLCFIFVIIGLSLVSMCINVIQSSLEDLYRKLLLKILTDYQAALNKDGSHKTASMGVMKSLGASKTAKYLLPILSENTKRSVMQQVQEEARDTGLEIPPIFEHFDTINEIINKTDVAKDEDKRSAIIDQILKPIVQSGPSSMMLARSASFNQRENHTQTDIVRREDKNDQTAKPETDELAIQTNLSLQREKTGVDVELQTDGMSASDKGIQTNTVQLKDVESMTSANTSITMSIQTDSALCLDEEVQTFELIDMFDVEIQTEEKATRNQRIQTPMPTRVDAEVQSEEVNKELEKIHGSRLRAARRRLRQAFNRSKARGIEDPTMLGWQEFDDEGEDDPNIQNSSEEGSLDWDPIDGMHAERQKPVSQLKKIFDEGEVGTSRQGSYRSQKNESSKD